MTPVEQRYRTVLRLLPASYRQRWEDDMVDAFLASVEPDDPEDAEFVAEYGRPPWSEVASVVALAVRLRIGTAGAPPRYAAWRHAIRLATLALLLSNAVSALMAMVMLLPLFRRVPGFSPYPDDVARHMRSDHWHTALTLIVFLWVPAYLTLLDGRVRVARLLVAGAVAGKLVVAVADVVRGHPFSLDGCISLLYDALALVALVAFGGDAPMIRARPWLVALPVAAAIQAVLLRLSWPDGGPAGLWLDGPFVVSMAVVGAAVVHLAVGSMRRRPYWSHALALLAGAVLVFLLAYIVDHLGNSSS